MSSDMVPGSSLQFKTTPAKILLLLVANTVIAFFIFVTSPGTKFIISLIFSHCIGISCAVFVTASINLFKTSKFPQQIAFIVTGMIVGAVIGVAAGYSIVRFVVPVVMPSVVPDEKYKLHGVNLLYALLFGSIFSYIFISHQKISDEKIRRLEVEKNAAVTEIKLLQSQVEPHFLFNTLSNILGLIDHDPEKAKRMLESFTSFLRSSLVTARSETITLSQEMDVVKNYLEIFGVRMGERLRYTVDIADSLRDFRVPPLLIQPLVENAVKHGLEPSVRGGELLIRAERDGERVRIIVADSGMGVNEMSPGSGIGLENIRKRLALLYGEQGGLILEENRPSGVRAVIRIPYETNPSDHSRR